jgi:hypothetical protein
MVRDKFHWDTDELELAQPGMAVADAWDPDEHPRDREGQFAQVASSVTKSEHGEATVRRVISDLRADDVAPTVEDVPHHKLRATQPTIYAHPDPALMGKHRAYSDLEDLPTGLKTSDGLVHISDGHHRADEAVREKRALRMNVYHAGTRALDAAWDPSKHPRNPAGGPHGGEFSSAEKEAIATFIGDDPYNNAIGINGTLREGKELTEKQKQTVAGMDSAIARAPRLESDKVFYRGTDTDVYPGRNKRDPYTVRDPGFTSLSSEKEVAEEFATATSRDDKGFVYEVHVPKGARALNVSEFQTGGMAYQKELVLPRLAMFERLGKPERIGNLTHVKLRYVI